MWALKRRVRGRNQKRRVRGGWTKYASIKGWCYATPSTGVRATVLAYSTTITNVGIRLVLAVHKSAKSKESAHAQIP